MRQRRNGLKFTRHFTKSRGAALDLIRWQKKDAIIYSPQGLPVFEMKGVEAPESYSSLAIEIAAQQYLHKKFERSVRSMIERVVGSIGKFGWSSGYFRSAKDRRCFEEELKLLLAQQKASFNSPVWFNVGLKQAYNIEGQQKLWRFDSKKKSVERTRNSFDFPQSSACFILSVNDSLDSIYRLIKTEAKIFKFGSGTGTNFSRLRAKGEDLASGGKSSGLISFLKVFDVSAAAVKSGGSTRRAAKMVVLDVNHPELLAFVEWKSREEAKAKALLRAGYSGGMDGEAYQSVTGQNANLSVRVTDKFMKAVKDEKPWKLKSRTAGNNDLEMPAKEIWLKLAKAAWECADPGLQFHDTIQKYHTCPAGGEINASNPCSEFMFLDDTACNLASINLRHFVDEAGRFLTEDFQRTVRLLIVAQDILVGMSGYPTKEVARNSVEYRPLGLGFANLGGTLMRLGIPYDSESARSWAASVTALMSGTANQVSSELAEHLGPFVKYKENKIPMLKVISRQKKSIKRIKSQQQIKEILSAAETAWGDALQRAKKSGFRNSQTTVIAPTGTIGLFMDCETTGIEPDFSLVKTKYLSGGGQLKFVNKAVEPALQRLGYSKEAIKELLSHLEKFGTLESVQSVKPDHLSIFDCAQASHEKGRSLSPEAHLRMMASVQPFLSGAISKTVNLRTSATVEEVANVYFRAWELGLKSISVYRDLSKGTQPLNVSPLCSHCGNTTIRSGSCFKCLNCGHSESCG